MTAIPMQSSDAWSGRGLLDRLYPEGQRIGGPRPQTAVKGRVGVVGFCMGSPELRAAFPAPLCYAASGVERRRGLPGRNAPWNRGGYQLRKYL